MGQRINQRRLGLQMTSLILGRAWRLAAVDGFAENIYSSWLRNTIFVYFLMVELYMIGGCKNHDFYIVLATNTEVSCRFSLKPSETNSANILTSKESKGFGKRGWKRKAIHVSTHLWAFYWHLPGVWSLGTPWYIDLCTEAQSAWVVKKRKKEIWDAEDWLKTDWVLNQRRVELVCQLEWMFPIEALLIWDDPYTHCWSIAGHWGCWMWISQCQLFFWPMNIYESMSTSWVLNFASSK